MSAANKDNHLDAAADLNGERPRPVLNGRTAWEVFEGDQRQLPQRSVFRKEERKVEEKRLVVACSRKEQASARRKAVEAVLLSYGLFKEIVDVSPKLNSEIATN